MNIAEKLTTISENVGKVFNAGYKKGKSEGHVEPSGTIKIEENGTYNVYEFADAFVNVPTYETENEQLTAEIARLTEEVEELNEEVAYNQQRILELQTENDSLIGTVQFLQNKVEGLNATIAEKQARITELEELVAELEAKRPSGSIEIKENGTYDVTDKAEAVVEVPTYEEELNAQKAIEDSIIDGSITSYFNDRVTVTETYSIAYRPNLLSAELSNLETIGNYTFSNCTALRRVKLQSLSLISNNAFRACANLTVLILENPNGCRLNSTSALTGTAIESGTGYVYVPDDLVDNYKTATNWVNFADQIKPISELEGEA